MVKRLRAAASSRYLGKNMSAQVVDTATGRVVWSQNSRTARMPASTQKTVTALTVLDSMPADARLTTTAQQSIAVPGNVYLKGAGDPTVTATRLTSLATQTAAQLKRQKRTRVNLYTDAGVFPAATNATGWKKSYVPGEVQPVRGLTLAGYRGTDNDLAAGRAFRKALTANGIRVVAFGRATTPRAHRQLAATRSVPVSSMVATMLRSSDNTYAEYLLRQSAAARGQWPTWKNSLANARRALTANGVPTTGFSAFDGSGLSRSNRMPTATLVATVTALHENPAMAPVAYASNAMPRAGVTGTLRKRYTVPTQRCARDLVVAKTGTLSDVVGLSGIARNGSGRTYAFAFLVNGPRQTSQMRLAVDQAATAVVGCR